MSSKNINKSLVGELQNFSLSDNIKKITSCVDLDYNGFSSYLTFSSSINNTFEKKDLEASRNTALMWFSSSENDYVREPGKGGNLNKLLGKIIEEDNLEYYEQLITEKFNNDFDKDLSIIYFKINKDAFRRSLSINAIIKDMPTKQTFEVTAEGNY